MPSKATKRDATRIKELAQTILTSYHNDGSTLESFAEDYLEQIVKIATDIDARSGRRDPSKRKPKKKSAKKR